jgi:hypothetical protein
MGFFCARHGGAVAWGPYVRTAIEIFGSDRCLMESDYPVESLLCGFVPLWNALKYIVRSATPEEKAALFHRTAARVYRIPRLELTAAAPSSADTRKRVRCWFPVGDSRDKDCDN